MRSRFGLMSFEAVNKNIWWKFIKISNTLRGKKATIVWHGFQTRWLYLYSTKKFRYVNIYIIWKKRENQKSHFIYHWFVWSISSQYVCLNRWWLQLRNWLCLKIGCDFSLASSPWRRLCNIRSLLVEANLLDPLRCFWIPTNSKIDSSFKLFRQTALWKLLLLCTDIENFRQLSFSSETFRRAGCCIYGWSIYTPQPRSSPVQRKCRIA